jgi:hypothetical protein
MAFTRKLTQLNILASGGNVNSPAYLVPNGSTRITAQFTYSGLSVDASLTLQQSTDGKNFDPVLDITGEPVTLILDKDNASATVNLVNLLTLWIRFQVDFAASVAGTISSVQYLTV